MSHTPGPWKVHRHNHVSGELWLTVVNGAWDLTHNGAKNAIADSRYSAMSDEENEANAHLIAAAPAMLEALEAIKADLTALGLWDYYSEPMGQSLSGACADIDAAIAQSKGEA